MNLWSALSATPRLWSGNFPISPPADAAPPAPGDLPEGDDRPVGRIETQEEDIVELRGAS